ncbi:hypothetical protein [Promicromonospora sp. NPDC023987]|uniref:hypothetical protein n=1 Tax=Promicromonospora sp. NPDC023987 TaxID=3155360 RepID=UPI0033FC734C
MVGRIAASAGHRSALGDTRRVAALPADEFTFTAPAEAHDPNGIRSCIEELLLDPVAGSV